MSDPQEIQGYIYLSFSNSEDEEKLSNQKRKAKAAKSAALKAELKFLLSQPLIAKGVSTRYITSGSTPIVDGLIAGECKSYFRQILIIVAN